MTTQDNAAPAATEEEVGALVDQLFMAGIGAFELLSIHLGVELGLYRALADMGSLTAPELAATAGIHPRYAREWLEQQATAELIKSDDPAATADERSYTLPPATAAVLLDETSLAHMAPIGAFVMSFASAVPELLDAYRTGGGVPFAHYGQALRQAQGAFNRPSFQHLLATDWLPNGLPDIHDRLSQRPAGKVADLGCGVGWLSIAFALAYPEVSVDGFDTDLASIEEANAHAQAAGVADRVHFEARDAAQPRDSCRYNLVTIFEALHDLSRPVDTLAAAREMLTPGGSVLVADEKVAEEFGALGDPVERFMYAASVLHCLPASMADQPTAATGTVIRPETVRRYATEAGFAAVRILPIEHDFFRFYRLEP